MNYTHKISNIGNGYPSVGETILDNNEIYFECVRISDNHTESGKKDWIYAIFEQIDFEVVLDYEDDFKDIKELYYVQELSKLERQSLKQQENRNE
jgi:hypothetical protein